MDASDVIAALALASIPISVLVARWQMRAPLMVERARWRAEARRTSYGLFQEALVQFRRSLMASEVGWEELNDAYIDLHNAAHVVTQVGPEDVARLADGIMRGCEQITGEVRDEISCDRLLSLEARAEAWAAQAPLRAELDKAIQRAYDSRWW